MSAPDTTPTALVTGAAGGIGSECVRSLAAGGYRVVAVDVELDRLEPVLTPLPDTVAVIADVSTTAGADEAIAACAGRIDVLLNVAGVGDGLMGVEELDDDRWDRVVAVNQTAAFRLAHRAVPLMRERGAGFVINMSSAAGLRGGRAGFAYTATKWALVGMAQNIAAELGPEGIYGHALCPSLIEGIQTLGRGEFSEAGRARSRRDSGKPAAGKPIDIANIVMFLLSDAARHLNGLALPVDAGWLAY